jgi:hypothetical protein
LFFEGSLLKGKPYRAICYRRQVSDIRADASEPMSTQHPLYG